MNAVLQKTGHEQDGHQCYRPGLNGYCLKMSRNPEMRRTLQEITNTFNQGRARRVSKRTLQRAICAKGYQRRVIRKAIWLHLPNKRNSGLVPGKVSSACEWFLKQSNIQ